MPDASIMDRGRRLRNVVIACVAATVIPLASWPSAAHGAAPGGTGLRVARFDVDVTPPIGLQMAYDAASRPADLALRSRGIVILGAGDPVVLAAIDWIGIGNAAHDAFRDALARAAGTSRDRVAVHALHQHDAPQADFTAEHLLAEMGVTTYRRFDGDFAREIIGRTADAVANASASAVPLTHAGFGRGKVEQVASNRRLLGGDGRIRGWRASTTADAALRAEPEGLIDPFATALVLWSGDKPVVVLTSYATHPMSYYRTGVPGPDFPGIARLLRSQDVPTALHLHFTGAGGNVAAGKYNDGAPANRVIFANRLAAGMRSAYDQAVADRHPVAVDDLGWGSVAVHLAARRELDVDSLKTAIRTKADRGTMNDADALAWVERCRSGRPIDITCLRLGDVRMLHMPGELFVEYQLAAQAMRPDLHVMMAAYGDYGPGYIGTAASYTEGGYEVEALSSFVGPEAEPMLIEAMRELLATDRPPKGVDAGGGDATPDADDHSQSLPRIPQVTADRAAETMRVAGGFRLALAASEPLLASPVAVDWDEDARLFVAEMRGYSEHRTDRLGRIRLLFDDDRDGDYDRATVFADGFAWPTAVCCWDGGVLVADAPDILLLRDRDGDGDADERLRLLTGFGTSNVQGLVNSLRFAPDNRVYGSASSAGGEVSCLRDDAPVGKPVSLHGRDFSFDPRGIADPSIGLDLRAETGGAQHGMSFDDVGQRYVCSNSDHAIRCMLDDRYLSRNADYPAPSGRESIAIDGPQAAVFRASAVEPWRVLRTRLRASGIVPGIVEGGGRPAGYFTSATGITVVRGEATGSLGGMLVIGDVGSNLVHRKRLVPHGASVRAERVDADGELVASTDIWFRPVQFANGPDGALWIVDMQREVIEHPDSLPPVIKRHLDLASGRESGRLWRLWSDDSPPPVPPEPLSAATTGELTSLIRHSDSWRRDTAHRLLVTRRDPAAVPHLEALLDDTSSSPAARLHAIWILAGLDRLDPARLEATLGDSDDAVRIAALRLAEPTLAVKSRPGHDRLAARLVAMVDIEPSITARLQMALTAGSLPDSATRRSVVSMLLQRDGTDDWCRIAACTSMRGDAAGIASAWLGDSRIAESPEAAAVMPALFAQIGRRGVPAEIDEALRGIASLAEPPHEGSTDRRRTATHLLVELDDAMTAAGRPEAVLSRAEAAACVPALVDWNRDLAFDTSRSPTDRAAAVRGASLRDVHVISRLLRADEPSAVIRAAIEAIDCSRDPGAGRLLLDAIPGLPDHAVDPAIAVLTRTADRARSLLDAIADGRITAEVLGQRHVDVLRRFPDAVVRRLAIERLGPEAPTDRRPLLRAYAASLPAAAGDPALGRSIFRRHCTACHRLEGVGHELGPALAAMRARGPEAMLVGILDPNREVLPAFRSRTVVRDDGRVVTGVLVAESDASVILRSAEAADHVIPRDEIESLVDTGRSLMPEGFERSIEPRAMADLLAYLLTAQ